MSDSKSSTRRAGATQARLWWMPWLFVGVVACGHERPPTTIEPSDLEARLRVGAIDPTSPLRSPEQLAEAARAASELGNVEEAVEYARAAQQAARFDAVRLANSGDRAARRAATRDWTERSDEYVALARAHGQADAALQAVLDAPDPRKHARALRWALGSSWVHGMRRRLLLRMFPRPADQRLILAATPELADGTWLAAFEALSPAQRRDPRLLDAALRTALNEGRERAAIVGLARELLEVDRWHIPARLVLGLDREVQRGAIVVDSRSFHDLAHPEAPSATPSIVRLRARAAATARPIWTLGLGHALLRGDLIGDAVEVLASAKADHESDAELLAALRAIAALQRGDAETFEAWHRRSGDPSSYLDGWLTRLDRKGQPEGIRRVAAKARQRLFAHRGRRDSTPLPSREAGQAATRTVADREAPARSRRAAGKLLEATPRSLRLARACRSEGITPDDCADLEFYDPRSPSPGLPNALEFHLRSGTVMPYWLFADAPELSTARLARTPMAATAEFQATALILELERKDWTSARARLHRFGPMIDAASLTVLTLALQDLEGGLEAAPRDLAFETLPSLDELTDLSEFEAGPGRAGRLLSALQQGFEDEAYAEALPELRALAQTQSGRVAAWIASYGVYMSNEAGDEASLRWFLERIDRHAPDAAIGHLARGWLASGPGSSRSATEHFAEALRRDPESSLAFEMWFASLTEDPTVSAERLIDALAAAPSTGYFPFASVAEALRHGTWTRDDVLAVVALSRGDLPEDVERLASRDPTIATEALYRLHEAIATTDDRATAVALAARALKVARHVEKSERWRRDRMGLHFLIDDLDGARRVAREIDRSTGQAWIDPHEEEVLLIEARGKGALDRDRAWTMWRWQWSYGEDSEAQVEAILAAASSPELVAIACARLADANRHEEALVQCRKAYAWSKSPLLGTKLSFAALNVGTPEALQVVREMDRAEPFPTFAKQPKQPLNGGYAASWWGNMAAFRASQSNPAGAAEAWTHAFALGHRGPDEEAHDQARYRGLTLRHRDHVNKDGSPESWARLAYFALLEQRLDIAETYARAAVAVAEGATPSARYRAGHRLAFVELAGKDIQARRLPSEALTQATELAFGDAEVEAMQSFADEHPKSLLARAILADAWLRERGADRAAPIVGALYTEAPEDPWIAVMAANLAMLNGQEANARKIYARVRRPHGDHLLVSAAALPESVKGKDTSVPNWLRSPTGFDARLRGAAAGRDPVRRVHIQQSVDVFVPDDFTATEQNEQVEFTSSKGDRLRVAVEARAARCQGEACARPLLGALRAEGMTVLWSRPIRLPAGMAFEFVATGWNEAVWAVSLPRGGRVFQMLARVEFDAIDRILGAARLARDTLRPLDGVVPAFRAESLRRAAAPLTDATRLTLRNDLAAPRPAKTGCPLAPTLDALPDVDARASALVDAWLASANTAQRATLLRCTAPERPESARIALLALVDEDARLHAWGRRAVRHHPDRAIADARTLFTSDLERPLSSPDHFTRRDLPPRGRIELAAALPPERRGEIIEAALENPDPRERAIGWALARMYPEHVSRAHVLRIFEGDDPERSSLALDALSESLRASEAPTLRARMDGLRPTTTTERALLLSIAGALGSFGDPADARRLAGAAERLPAATDEADEEHRATIVRGLTGVAKAHASFVKDKTGKDTADSTLEDIVDAWTMLRRAREPSTENAPVAAKALAERALPELLPGRDWLYAKVSNPRLVATTAKALLARLRTDGPIDQKIVEQIVQRAWESSGATLFQEDNGIDLGRGVECASAPDVLPGHVCMAYVVDRNRLLTLLGQRDHGEDSGLVLPVKLAPTLGYAPLLLSLAPSLVHQVVHSESEPPSEQRVVAQRARGEFAIGPHVLERYVIIEGQPSDVSIDVEHYLLVGDRVFVFTTETMARAVLQPSANARLADDPEFRRLTEAWTGGASLSAVSLGNTSDLDVSGSIEVAIDADGVRYQFRGHMPVAPGSAQAVARRLPADAASAIAVGRGIPRIPMQLRIADDDAPDRGRLPPDAIMRSEGALAFGWYPTEGRSLWQHWVAVLQPTPADRKRLATAGLLARRDDRLEFEGALAFAKQGDVVVIGSDERLVERAIEAPRPGAPEPDLVLRGHYRGDPAGDSVAGLPYRGAMAAGAERILAAGLRLIDHSEYRATFEPSGNLLSVDGRFSLAVTKGEQPPELVDAWLASKESSNAVMLPRTLRPAELGQPLAYELAVPDPRAFVERVVTKSARIDAQATGDRVRLVVRPNPGDATNVLTAAERKRRLEPTSEYPAHHARVQKIVRAVVGSATDPAEIAARINAWVHRRITYEVTPRHLDGIEILDAGRGDCSEYATLAVTLLRAAGVPAEHRSGMAASGDDMVAHAWVAYHDGKRWNEMDPTAGTTTVSAGHIELSVIDVLALASMGNLRVISVGRP